jgi:hypothetical protein
MSVQNYISQSNWFKPNTAPSSAAIQDDSNDTSQFIRSTVATDSVSISTRAQKLSQIHEEFFASGPISSDKIRELSVRMHEEGLLEAADVRRLTGEAPPDNSIVGKSISFLSDYIDADPDQSNHAELSQALEVLITVDQALTPEKLALEQQSHAFIKEHQQSLQEANVSSGTLKEFDNIVSVFDALARARSDQGPENI